MLFLYSCRAKRAASWLFHLWASRAAARMLAASMTWRSGMGTSAGCGLMLVGISIWIRRQTSDAAQCGHTVLLPRLGFDQPRVAHTAARPPAPHPGSALLNAMHSRRRAA